MPAAGKAERRADPNETSGKKYAKEAFLELYGKKRGQKIWGQAGRGEKPALKKERDELAAAIKQERQKLKKMEEKLARLDKALSPAAMGAPFLEQYYHHCAEVMGEKMFTADKMLEQAQQAQQHPGGQAAFLEEMRKDLSDLVMKDGKALLEKSFAHHDVDKNGVLSKEEATVFLTHLTERVGPYMKSIMARMTAAASGMMMKVLGAQLPPEMKSQMSEKVVVEVEKMMGVVRRELEKVLDEYKKNKAERDAAAFKIADANGDGTLQLSEFLEVMTPNTEKSKAWTKALGFDEDKLQAELEANAPNPQQCLQQ